MKRRQQVLVLAILFPLAMVAQNRYDVVIDEIMADPSPLVGLPNNEWIELRNSSSISVNLQNWRMGDASSQSGAFPNYILKPDSCVIVCASSAITSMSVFGNTISVTSFPSLDNDGDQLFLKSASGIIIHAVNYSSSWYKSSLKKEGGWTLEMIDTKNPCSGAENWEASVHPNGGTPGKWNSVNALNNDNSPPRLLSAYILDNLNIVLLYDQTIDSTSAALATNYSIDGGIIIATTSSIPPLFNQVQIKLLSALSGSTIYTITANNVKDCSGNRLAANSKTKVGLPSAAGMGDCIINEVLFNPRSPGVDYVEFFNNSDKILDASQLYIANRNGSGVTGSIKQVSLSPFYIFPGEYIVLTEDSDLLAQQYLVKYPDRLLTVTSMPSYPDDEGIVSILNSQGEIIDELHYYDDWHFKLIADDEGVSLERIDPGSATQQSSNWHSAASTAGYGTPGYRNSQYKAIAAIDASIKISPVVFSPDNDGKDDVATLQYSMTEPGYMATIVIYDPAGRPVRRLVQNELLGITGYANWDGLDDRGNRLPVGIYIIFTQLFNLQGKNLTIKSPVVLARKLN